MDPVAYKGFPKDGNWEFPPDTTFPFVARVMVKFFKVAIAEVASQDGAQTKYLNTKIVKAEVSLTQEDLHSKASLVAAIERDCDVKTFTGDESIQNPKVDISIKRKDSAEIFSVTKMKFVVKRLDTLKDRSDTILVEVKEQIVSFQANRPTIKVMINSVPQESSAKRRNLAESVVKNLDAALKKLENSRYDKETKRIVCGKCSVGVKTRDSGAVKSIVKYFDYHHFKVCGNKEVKRKAKQDKEDNEKEKRRKVVDKMDKYWNALRSKTAEVEEREVTNKDEDEDMFEDPDLIFSDSEVEICSTAGPSKG